jgi:uncharacterized protein YndB with AHSA1/START domain
MPVNWIVVPHVSVTREIPASQAEVWSLLSDLANAGKWNSAWTRVEFLSNQTHGIGTQFSAHTESGDAFEFEIATWSSPECLEIRPIRSSDEPEYPVMLESHEFRLSPLDTENDTLVELRANASSHGIRGWLIATFIWPGHQREGLMVALDGVFDALVPDSEKVEPGEPPEPLPS